jgi:hypothetical protein
LIEDQAMPEQRIGAPTGAVRAKKLRGLEP